MGGLIFSVALSGAMARPLDTGADTAPGAGSARPRARSALRRSSRAYEHWLRACLAKSPRGRAEQLLLARVYDESSPRLLEALVRARTEAGQLSRARRSLTELARRAPRRPSVLDLRSALERAAGRPARALRAARKAFERAPTWPRGQRLADLRASVEGEEARVAVLERSVDASLLDPAPARALAEALEAQGPLEASRSARETAAERAALSAGALGAAREDLESLIELDHRLGDDALALARARELARAWPTEPALRRVAVAAALWAGRLDAAEALALEALELRVLERLEVARLFAREGIFRGAALAWLRAERERLPPRVLVHLARSERAARRALARVPPGTRFEAAQLLLAALLRDRGRLEAAERSLRRGARRAESPETRAALAAEADRVRAAREGSSPGSTRPDPRAAIEDGLARGQAAPEDGPAPRAATVERLARGQAAPEDGPAPRAAIVERLERGEAAPVPDPRAALVERLARGEAAPGPDRRAAIVARLARGEARPEDGPALDALRAADPDDPLALALDGRWHVLRAGSERSASRSAPASAPGDGARRTPSAGDLDSSELRHGRNALERAARLSPRDAEIWSWLAHARERAGDAEGARAARARSEARRAADRRARRGPGPLSAPVSAPPEPAESP